MQTIPINYILYSSF